MVSSNVRSFSKNLDVCSSYIYKLEIVPDVVILKETKFSEGNADNVQGYISFNSALSEKSGGGVSVFLKKTI